MLDQNSHSSGLFGQGTDGAHPSHAKPIPAYRPRTPALCGGQIRFSGPSWFLSIIDASTSDVEVVPNGVSLSITSCRCSTETTFTFRMNESSPVPLWHSTISGIVRNRCVNFTSTLPTTLILINAEIGNPTACGLISARYARIIPSSSILRTRCATAGVDSPTRRPNSANGIRPSFCSSVNSFQPN